MEVTSFSSGKRSQAFFVVVALSLLLAAAAYGGYWYGKREVKPVTTPRKNSQKPTSTQSSSRDAIQLEGLTLGDTISSPLSIKGTVLASWMFEGVFPIKLLDNQRKEITRALAEQVVPGDWSSGKERVAFKATLTFSTKATSGYLVFEADNPSGLPENAESFEVPVKFSQSADETAGWETYTNQDFGFSFKYPQEFTVTDSNPELHSLQVVGREEKGDTFTFSVYSNKKWSDESLYFQNNPSNGSKTVNGVVWKTFFAPATGGVGSESTPDRFALQTVKNSVFYQIYFNNVKDTTGFFNQILPTFRFLDQN